MNFLFMFSLTIIMTGFQIYQEHIPSCLFTFCIEMHLALCPGIHRQSVETQSYLIPSFALNFFILIDLLCISSVREKGEKTSKKIF